MRAKPLRPTGRGGEDCDRISLYYIHAHVRNCKNKRLACRDVSRARRMNREPSPVCIFRRRQKAHIRRVCVCVCVHTNVYTGMRVLVLL